MVQIIFSGLMIPFAGTSSFSTSPKSSESSTVPLSITVTVQLCETPLPSFAVAVMIAVPFDRAVINQL